MIPLPFLRFPNRSGISIRCTVLPPWSAPTVWKKSCRPRRRSTTNLRATIVFGLTGTGYFDMTAYEKFHDGKMSDYIPTDEDLQKSLSKLPKID